VLELPLWEIKEEEEEEGEGSDCVDGDFVRFLLLLVFPIKKVMHVV